MRRFRSGGDSPVTLFPFLSILACVIGVLTLVITGLVVGQLGGSQARAAEYADLDRQIAENQAEMGRLRTELAQADSSARKAKELEREVERKQKQLTRPIEELRADRKRVEALSKLKSDRDDVQAELDRKRQTLEQVQAELRKASGEGLIVLKPSGSGRDTKPEFVECTADGLILHPSKTRVAAADIAAGAAFKQLVDRVKQRSGWAIVFLIRPDDGAVKSFDQARSQAEGASAAYGYLALPHKGEIDFSVLTPGKP